MHPRECWLPPFSRSLLPAGASAAELKTVEVPTGGFSIALPSSWVNVTSAAPIGA